MASTMMQKNMNLRQAFSSSATARPAARSARCTVRASQPAKEQPASKAPSELVMKTFGALAAAQLAFLPVAGPVLARDAAPNKGKLGVEGALQAGKAAQDAVPKGAIEPKTREDRNDSRDQNLAVKLDVLKQRIDADAILSSPDIESGGRQNIFAPGAKGVAFDAGVSAPSLQFNVGFNPAEQALLHTVGNPVALKDLAGRQPNVDPFAPAENKLPIQPGQVADVAGEAVEKVKDAAPSGGLGGLEALADKIRGAAVTNNSPQRQLEQNADKAAGPVQDAIKSAPQTKNVAFNPQSAGSLMHTVGAFTANKGPNAQLDKDGDMGNASFQGPEGNGGGVTQPTTRPDQDLSGNPKRGGDLKDAPTDFAAQNKMERDEGTPAQTGASPRAGANTPKGVGELRNPQTPTLPNALGGKGFLRDDSETPEATAEGNIAKARASSGNAVDSLKQGLGL